jgi:four helix bundle protein
MNGPTTHRDLAAWREAMALAVAVYRQTASFPKEEVYGLTSQIRRAAVSIPSNIAEGAGRNSSREQLQFLGITFGSLAELDTQLDLAVQLGYMDAGADVLNQASRVGMLVRLLRKSIRNRSEVVTK